MILKNIKAKDQGFTIVELLVVIVVIGILAAITIVSYTGITARANAAATKQMASNIIAKAGIYQTEGSTLNWPLTAALAMSATNSSAAITGVSLQNASAAMNAAAMDKISYQICGTTTSTTVTTAPADYAAVAAGNVTGIVIGYWDYGKTPTAGEATLSAGQTSGTGYTVNGTTYANIVACKYSAT